LFIRATAPHTRGGAPGRARRPARSAAIQSARRTSGRDRRRTPRATTERTARSALIAGGAERRGLAGARPRRGRGVSYRIRKKNGPHAASAELTEFLVPRNVRPSACTVEFRRRAQLRCRSAVPAGSATHFPRGRGNGRRREARQDAMRIFFGWMRIAGRSPRRTGARGPHHLMRDPENHPTRSTISVSGTLSDGIFPRTPSQDGVPATRPVRRPKGVRARQDRAARSSGRYIRVPASAGSARSASWMRGPKERDMITRCSTGRASSAPRDSMGLGNGG
jgi:hypothetical protein